MEEHRGLWGSIGVGLLILGLGVYPAEKIGEATVTQGNHAPSWIVIPGLLIALIGAYVVGAVLYQLPLPGRAPNKASRAPAGDGSVGLSLGIRDPLLDEVVPEVRVPSHTWFTGVALMNRSHRYAEARFPDDFVDAPHSLPVGLYKVLWRGTQSGGKQGIVGRDRFRIYRSRATSKDIAVPPSVAASVEEPVAAETTAPAATSSDVKPAADAAKTSPPSQTAPAKLPVKAAKKPTAPARTADLARPELAFTGMKVEWVKEPETPTVFGSSFGAGAIGNTVSPLAQMAKGDHWARLYFRGWGLDEPIEQQILQCRVWRGKDWDDVKASQSDRFVLPGKALVVSFQADAGLLGGHLEYVMRYAVGSFARGEERRVRHRFRFLGTPESKFSFGPSAASMYEWSTVDLEWLNAESEK